jgi:hypothetical protein
MMSCRRLEHWNAFTLVDLLIVAGIVGLLLQCGIPALDYARESSREKQCVLHLSQLAAALQMHHDIHEHYPTSGWGWQWVGHPERGYGDAQPGGWAYNVLPHIGFEHVRELGTGLPEGSRQLQLAILSANATPISIFNCPSRRSPGNFPMVVGGFVDKPGFSPLLPKECREGSGIDCRVTRSDYAINSGNINPGTEPGPNALLQSDSWNWEYSGPNGKRQNGISHQRSHISRNWLTDGVSKVYCVGEKYVPAANYENGRYLNDDLSTYVGHDGDMNRYTGDVQGRTRKLTSDNEAPENQQFGSAHSAGFYMAFCDGSVHLTSYETDPEIHRALGGRDDGTKLQFPFDERRE